MKATSGPSALRRRWRPAVLLAAMLSLAVAACGSTHATSTSASSSSSNQALHIYAWAGEVPQSIVSAFEKQTGISVTVDTATSNEAMIAKLAAGNSGYDVIEPSQYAVQELVQQNLIVPIDHGKLTGLSQISVAFKHPSYDPGETYSIPWVWGTTGLLYNSKCTGGTENSWSVLWNTKFKGKLYMLDNELSAYIPALQINGYHATSKSQAQIAKATQSLVTQKPLLAGYNSTNYAQLVESGQACAAEAYSGGTSAAAVAANPDVHYILPKQGGTVWVDSFSIVKGATNVAGAYRWLNFVLQPKIAAEAAKSADEATANQAAYAYIPPADLHNTAIYAPLGEVAHADFILDPGSALNYFNQGWLQVSAG
jgi:spermidine/putrescine transport system substrate-binding protein